MKNILILGASSNIGAALSQKFSAGNNIILTGRNQVRLQEVSSQCMTLGANAVKAIPSDLALSIEPILNINSQWPIGLIIDVASTASSYLDREIHPFRMADIFQSDLLSRLALYKHLTDLNGVHPNIIFISTVLATLITPNRQIYSLVKRLNELYLTKIIHSNPKPRILIYRIGKRLNNKTDSLEVEKISALIKNAYEMRRIAVTYGVSGKILIVLNNLHPALSNFLIKIQRLLR